MHRVLRGYASLHLAATYAAYVGGLDGLPATVQPEGWEGWLSVLGLWHPRVVPGMLPLLALLLLVRLLRPGCWPVCGCWQGQHEGACQKSHRVFRFNSVVEGILHTAGTATQTAAPAPIPPRLWPAPRIPP